MGAKAKGNNVSSITLMQLMKPCKFLILPLMFFLSSLFGHLITWSWCFKIALYAHVTKSFMETLKIPIIWPIFCNGTSFWLLPNYFSNSMMCTIDDHLTILPETLLKTSSFSTSLCNCMIHNLSIWKLDKNSSSVMYVPSWSIRSQLLSHYRYEPQKMYHNDFNTASFANMQ